MVALPLRKYFLVIIEKPYHDPKKMSKKFLHIQINLVNTIVANKFPISGGYI